MNMAKPAAIGLGHVLAQAAHQAVVDTGAMQGGGHLHQAHARGDPQQLPGLLGGQRALRNGPARTGNAR